jgi:hypothetical protein
MNPPENQEPTRILLVDDELPAISSAARQYQLITSERVLLEQTLHGSIHALIGALSLANPVAFGRASRIKARVRDLADAAGLTDLWRIEVAAMLSRIGLIALSPETVDKLATGEPLSQAERDTLDRMPEIIEQLLGQIPRLESMRAMIAFAGRPWEGHTASKTIRCSWQDPCCVSHSSSIRSKAVAYRPSKRSLDCAASRAPTIRPSSTRWAGFSKPTVPRPASARCPCTRSPAA